MQKLIIGCPVKNDTESLTAMIDSLYDSTDVNYELLFVIGKGCNKETIDYITNLPFKDGVEVSVSSERTETPLEAYNLIFEYSKKQKSDLLLTQTDVLFTTLYKRDWLGQMKDIAQNEDVGAVTCINGGGISGADYIAGFHWLGGWCTYYPNRTIEKIGGYDKDFPNGYGVDIDHTYRIAKEGLKIVKLNYWCDHHMMNERTHDKAEDTEQMKQDSSKYFKKKWKLN